MAKGKRKYRMPTWRKVARAAVGLVGKGVGALVAISPTFRGLEFLVKGDVKGAAEAITYDTTGLSTVNPSFQLDAGKLVRTGVLVGVGIGLMALFSRVARRI